MTAYLPLLRLFQNPALALPHASVSTFADLPVPLSTAFSRAAFPGAEKTEDVDIRAVVLDKDNCFAADGEVQVYPAYAAKLKELRESMPAGSVVVVSNSGSLRQSSELQDKLYSSTKLPLLLQSRENDPSSLIPRKPSCAPDVWSYFQGKPDLKVDRPDQIVVIGDRIATDVVLANLMGARSIWIRDGVNENASYFAPLERRLVDYLVRKGYQAPTPKSIFEGA